MKLESIRIGMAQLLRRTQPSTFFLRCWLWWEGAGRGNTHKISRIPFRWIIYIGPSLRLSKRFQKLPPSIMISTEHFFFGEAQKDHSAYRMSAASSAATSPPPWAQNKNGESILGACGHKSLENCEKIAHIKCLKCKSDKSDKSHKILATSDT